MSAFLTWAGEGGRYPGALIACALCVSCESQVSVHVAVAHDFSPEVGVISEHAGWVLFLLQILRALEVGT